MVIPNGKFKFFNFEVGCQNMNTLTSSVGQPKEPSQNVMTMEASKGKRKRRFVSNETIVQAINESRENILAIKGSLIEVM